MDSSRSRNFQITGKGPSIYLGIYRVLTFIRPIDSTLHVAEQADR